MTNRADDELGTPRSVLTSPPQAWITYRRKDGKGVHRGTIATNQDYIKAHKEWKWIPITIPEDK